MMGFRYALRCHVSHAYHYSVCTRSMAGLPRTLIMVAMFGPASHVYGLTELHSSKLETIDQGSNSGICDLAYDNLVALE